MADSKSTLSRTTSTACRVTLVKLYHTKHKPWHTSSGDQVGEWTSPGCLNCRDPHRLQTQAETWLIKEHLNKPYSWTITYRALSSVSGWVLAGWKLFMTIKHFCKALWIVVAEHWPKRDRSRRWTWNTNVLKQVISMAPMLYTYVIMKAQKTCWVTGRTSA